MHLLEDGFNCRSCLLHQLDILGHALSETYHITPFHQAPKDPTARKFRFKRAIICPFPNEAAVVRFGSQALSYGGQQKQ
eukprot:4398581-Amphidinium_carterae.1